MMAQMQFSSVMVLDFNEWRFEKHVDNNPDMVSVYVHSPEYPNHLESYHLIDSFQDTNLASNDWEAYKEACSDYINNN